MDYSLEKGPSTIQHAVVNRLELESLVKDVGVARSPELLVSSGLDVTARTKATQKSAVTGEETFQFARSGTPSFGRVREDRSDGKGVDILLQRCWNRRGKYHPLEFNIRVGGGGEPTGNLRGADASCY